MTPFDPNEPLWDDLQAAEFLRLSPGSLRKARMSGGGPPYMKIGHRVRYVPRLVVEWCAERAQHSTAERQDHEPLCPTDYHAPPRPGPCDRLRTLRADSGRSRMARQDTVPADGDR
jgi:hypothetical protein